MRVTRACAVGAAAATSAASAKHAAVRDIVFLPYLLLTVFYPRGDRAIQRVDRQGIATMAKRHRAPKRQAAAPKREWPLFRSLAAYRPEFITGDLIAGLTLAAIAIPEQMATAGL